VRATGGAQSSTSSSGRASAASGGILPCILTYLRGISRFNGIGADCPYYSCGAKLREGVVERAINFSKSSKAYTGI